MLTIYVPAAIALWLALDLFVVLLIGAFGRAVRYFGEAIIAGSNYNLLIS